MLTGRSRLAPTGKDALACWERADRNKQPRPTVIVANKPEQLHKRQAELGRARQVEVVTCPEAHALMEQSKKVATKAEVVERDEKPALEAHKQAEVRRQREIEEQQRREMEQRRELGRGG